MAKDIVVQTNDPMTLDHALNQLGASVVQNQSYWQIFPGLYVVRCISDQRWIEFFIRQQRLARVIEVLDGRYEPGIPIRLP